jgi:hypothetical protein
LDWQHSLSFEARRIGNRTDAMKERGLRSP